MSECSQDLQKRHPAEQSGNDRCHRHDQQRIESQREPEDDQRNPEQRPIIDHSSRLPNPPPPGVSMTKRSPGRTSTEAVALSMSIEPSVRSTQLRAACASLPPSI